MPQPSFVLTQRAPNLLANVFFQMEGLSGAIPSISGHTEGSCISLTSCPKVRLGVQARGISQHQRL